MSKIEFQWINDNQKLAEICQMARTKAVVALDTEFIRTRSFYPKLGLIQLYDGQNACLIDPLAISDFSPFVALLADQKVVKVLHSCSEDLEVFQHQFKQLPEPLLDTQIMASFLGLGQSLGYAKLVQQYLSIELDKGFSRTDWLMRPLTSEQCQYAIADVVYLLPVYQQLARQLAESQWQTAVAEECQSLLRKREQPFNPEQAYLNIGNAWRLEPKKLAILKVLAKWRYEEAIKRDLALNFVVKEQALWQIAEQMPRHTSALLDFMHPNEVRIHGKKLLWLVEQGLAVPTEQYPPTIERLEDVAGYKAQIKQLQQKLAEILPLGFPPELLAAKRQLNQLLQWHRTGQAPEKCPELLQGWRKPYGQALLAVLQ